MGTFGPLFIISRRWRRVTHLIETLVKMKINYPPKILCQTVSFYLLHRDNISKIACKYPLPASILYYVQVMNAEGAKWGVLQWGTLSSENAYSKTKPVLGGYEESIRHCSLSMVISTQDESFWEAGRVITELQDGPTAQALSQLREV